LAWIGGVGLLGLTPAMLFAQGLPQPPSLENAAASQRVAPGAASQDVVQTGGTDQRNFRPRDLLQQGVENYRKGEYEVADVYLKKAQEFRGQLSQAEQRDLDASLQRNAQAIELRKQGQDQIKRASEAFNTGRYQEATALIKSVQVNQYVRAEDKQSAAKLGDLIAKTGAPVQPAQPTAPAPVNAGNPQVATMPAGRTPADMVKHSRGLFNQGDLDGAHMWAMTALQQGAKRGFFWEDSAEKVLRDVEAARKRTGTVAGQATPAINPNASLEQRQQQARQLCMEAKRALDKNDLARAKALTRQAESLNANLSWVEDYSPQKMNQLIASRETPGTAQPAQPMTANGDPRAMLREAKVALERGDVERAEQLAMAARGMTGVKYSMFESNPESVLAEVAKVREAQNGRKAGELLVQARNALNAGNLDEAERLASQSKMLKSSYSVLDFGDRPDKVLDECRVKRQLANRNKSLTEPAGTTMAQRTPVSQPPVTVAGGTNTPAATTPPALAPTPPAMPTVDPKVAQGNRLMAEARQHLNRGEYELALNKAMAVKSMGVVTLDKPDDIYQAVKVAQEGRTVASPVADAKRTKALQLMAGARLKMKSGDILGARKDAGEAKSMGAIFHQGDDLPDAVLAELSTKAREQVDTYSKAADTLAQRGRHGEAQQYRNYVANVAMTFNVPAPQMAAVKATPAPANSNDLAMQGSKLCTEIDGCLKDGQYAQARKLANALAEGPYGLKVKANEYLVKLDAEETKAAIKTTEQHFDLFVRAMNRKDYDVARSYAEKVDKRHLDAAKGKQFNELLANPSYQQHVAGNDKVNPSQFQQAHHAMQDGPAGKGSAQSPLLDELKKKHEIEYQRLRAMSLASISKATRLSQNGNVDAAVAELKGTLETIKKADPDVPKVVEMTRQLETAVNRHQKLAEQIALEREKTEALTARKTAGERRLRAEESRREQIATLMREAKKLMNDGKYAEAEALAEKAKAIDPDDVSVDAVHEFARRSRRFHDEQSLVQRTVDGNTTVLHDLGQGMVAPVGDARPLTFDREFSKKSPARLRALMDRIQKTKREDFPSNSRMGSTVSIDFRNKPLEEAIDELRVMSGVNMITDATALAYAGVDTKAPITLTLNGVSLKTALDCLLQNAQLTYVIHNGIIKITTREAKAKLSNEVKHFAVHDLITPRDDMAQLDNHNPEAQTVSGNANMSPLFVAKDVGYNGPSNSGGGGQMNGAWQTRRTGQTLERQLENLITSSIAPETWAVNGQGGQGTIKYFPIGMTFVISQQSDIQEQIEDLLRRLRELQEVQITVEVRILTLTDDFFERMGVDFNVLIPDKQTAFDRQVANANFAPNGQLNSNDHLKGVIVGLTPNGNFTNNLDIPISNDSYRQARLPTGFAGIGPPGSAGGLDIGVAFLSSIQVFLVMEAVQGDVRNSTLQAPKITLFNGQVASISSSRTELFVTSVTAVPNFFTGIPVFIPQQTPFQSGVFLTLQAVVTHDRRYVQLTLSPNIQRVEDSGRTFQAVAGITLQQPVTSNINVATTVMVPDGGTILVGGLKTMQEQRREFGPPILSKIPYVNRFFRNQSYGKSGTSLMFMVTPRIIINEEEEEKLGNTFSF
jgi:type II secretory pathway component GspD/PulD (secretin)/tetratricopeptide (TPR) repeat protein